MRWLLGRVYGNPNLPTRWAWVLVFATFQTAASWIGGRLW